MCSSDLIQTRLNASGIRANQVDEFLAFILTTFLTGLTEEDRSSCNLKNLPPAVRKGFVINASINFLNYFKTVQNPQKVSNCLHWILTLHFNKIPIVKAGGTKDSTESDSGDDKSGADGELDNKEDTQPDADGSTADVDEKYQEDIEKLKNAAQESEKKNAEIQQQLEDSKKEMKMLSAVVKKLMDQQETQTKESKEDSDKRKTDHEAKKTEFEEKLKQQADHIEALIQRCKESDTALDEIKKQMQSSKAKSTDSGAAGATGAAGSASATDISDDAAVLQVAKILDTFQAEAVKVGERGNALLENVKEFKDSALDYNAKSIDAIQNIRNDIQESKTRQEEVNKNLLNYSHAVAETTAKIASSVTEITSANEGIPATLAEILAVIKSQSLPTAAAEVSSANAEIRDQMADIQHSIRLLTNRAAFSSAPAACAQVEVIPENISAELEFMLCILKNLQVSSKYNAKCSNECFWNYIRTNIRRLIDGGDDKRINKVMVLLEKMFSGVVPSDDKFLTFPCQTNPSDSILYVFLLVSSCCSKLESDEFPLKRAAKVFGKFLREDEFNKAILQKYKNAKEKGVDELATKDFPESDSHAIPAEIVDLMKIKFPRLNSVTAIHVLHLVLIPDSVDYCIKKSNKLPPVESLIMEFSAVPVWFWTRRFAMISNESLGCLKQKLRILIGADYKSVDNIKMIFLSVVNEWLAQITPPVNRSIVGWMQDPDACEGGS